MIWDFNEPLIPIRDLAGPSGAVFDPTNTYRWLLWRRWNISKGMVMFIGLNPSRAGEFRHDPTIRRVAGFAKRWGFGGMFMMNLFSYISTDPDNLQTWEEQNFFTDQWLDHIALESDAIVFCWGRFKEARERSLEVMAKFPGAYCIEHNKDNTPVHPLFAPRTWKMKSYGQKSI